MGSKGFFNDFKYKKPFSVLQQGSQFFFCGPKKVKATLWGRLLLAPYLS